MSELQREWPGSNADDGMAESAPVGVKTETGTRRTPVERTRLWWAVGVPAGLYLLSAALLLFGLDSHPGFTYNWENNTANGLFAFMDQPTLSIFHLTEGLMTDSGSSPLVVLPAWLGFAVGGVGIGSMRWPVALIAAGAVPLLWLVGKRIAGALTGLLAALLLALSPVFLLYARTATNVGVSIVLMLLTVYVLLRLLEQEQPGRWLWPVALQGTLIVGAYGYAPVRFLWLFSVGLLALEAFLRKEHRKRLVASAALTLVVMAGTITALDYDHEHDFVTSVGYYYAGRGEQVANLLVSEEDYAHTVGRAGDTLPSTWELLAQTVGQNSADLANLLLDRDTQPAITDYWNPHGRLIPLLLVPFFLLGFGRAIWLACRRDGYRYRLLVLFFLGFTLPMVFTSRVHIGRLIFAVPLLFLLVAAGVGYCLLLIAYGLTKIARMGDRARRLVPGAVVVVLLVLVALSTWNDYSVEVPPTKEALITQELIKEAGTVREEGGYAALVAVDDPTLILETIDANQYRLGLDRYYCFYNLSIGQGAPCSHGDSRPTLLVGGLLERLNDPTKVPGYCTDIYYVAPGLLDKFRAALGEHSSECPQPPRYKVLSD
jgi:4-amino-4-deoxy-L-arabinose transferase-like glycosyltransferase